MLGGAEGGDVECGLALAVGGSRVVVGRRRRSRRSRYVQSAVGQAQGTDAGWSPRRVLGCRQGRGIAVGVAHVEGPEVAGRRTDVERRPIVIALRGWSPVHPVYVTRGVAPRVLRYVPWSAIADSTGYRVLQHTGPGLKLLLINNTSIFVTCS